MTDDVLGRIADGRSKIPELAQVSAILFHVSEPKRVIEMVSVDGDETLWVMTGPLGGEIRITPAIPNVTAGRFESRMDYSDDDPKSWKPANRRVFSRVNPVSS